jgi:ABC-2 type transport system permease protein
MNKVATLARRELRHYFHSPVAYVVLVSFTLLAGYFFTVIFNYYTMASFQAMQDPYLARFLDPAEGIVRPLLSNLGVVMLFMIPLLSMRLFAEEKKSGAAELLFTYPLRDWQILAGKYGAALAFIGVMLGTTLLFPLTVDLYGDLDWGPVLAGYLGLLLLGAAFLALGTFISSLTENQIVAGTGTFAALLLFWVLGWVNQGGGEGEIGKVLGQLSLLEHFRSFPQGILDTADLVFFVNFAFLFLFLTLRSLESKRWRG